MRILLINANTSQPITELLAADARASASPETEILAVTGRFGPRIIGSRAENAIAMHACLDVAARHYRDCDAAVVAVSLDTALPALRDLLPIPVTGMTEAALMIACTFGPRFGIVTAGARTPELYRELVESYGLGQRLAAISAIDLEAGEAFRDRARTSELLAASIQELLARDGADCVVLAGAVFCGFGRDLQPRVEVPVLDGVACAVRQAELLVRGAAGLARPRRPLGGESIGLGEALSDLLSGRAD